MLVLSHIGQYSASTITSPSSQLSTLGHFVTVILLRHTSPVALRHPRLLRSGVKFVKAGWHIVPMSNDAIKHQAMIQTLLGGALKAAQQR